MRRISTTLIGLALLALSACSGSADPSPPAPSPSATTQTPTPTPSPSPTPPTMPDAARAHTKAGAKAFVRHFWDVVDYAQQSGETAPVNALTLPGCGGCEGGVRGIDRVYDAGGTIRGGQTTTKKFHIEWLKAGSLDLAHVTVDLMFAGQTIDMPGTDNDKVSRSSHARDRLELVAEPNGWKVAQLVVLP